MTKTGKTFPYFFITLVRTCTGPQRHRITAMQSRITPMPGYITPPQGYITPMQGDITPMQGDITPMQNCTKTMQTYITPMRIRNKTMQSYITTNQPRFALKLTIYNSQLSIRSQCLSEFGANSGNQWAMPFDP